MSIEKKTEQQLVDLQNTLEECPHIEKVHFTAKGDHYFNVHELIETKTEMKNGKVRVNKINSGKYYGYLKTAPVEHGTNGNKVVYKNVSVHTPASLIVKTMTREEVLEYEFVENEANVPKEKKGARKKKEATPA